MNKRLLVFILTAFGAIVILSVAVFIIRPDLLRRAMRQVMGDPAVPGLDVSPGRARFPVKGIDISHHNGPVDFRAVAADSVDFVIIKATEGVSHTDSCLMRNYEGARAAGLMTGFYHFFRFNRGGVRQGRHFLNTVKSLRSDLPLVIDFETAANPETDYYLVVGRLRDMAAYLRRHGRRVMIYCNHKEYDRYIRGTFDDLDLWLASGRLPDGDDRRHLWQHSHNGHVAGITKPVDINTFNGSRDDFYEWLSIPAPRPVEPRATLPPDTTAVADTINASPRASENQYPARQ